MKFLDWMRRGGGPKAAESKTEAITRPVDGMPFRFEKAFAHLEHLMSPEERKVVQGIEARWKERYETFKDYPPMSEGQEREGAVFRAVDSVHRAMDARQYAAYEQWKEREAEVDKAFADTRMAFGEQRNFVTREVARTKDYERKLSPDRGGSKPDHSPAR